MSAPPIKKKLIKRVKKVPVARPGNAPALIKKKILVKRKIPKSPKAPVASSSSPLPKAPPARKAPPLPIKKVPVGVAPTPIKKAPPLPPQPTQIAVPQPQAIKRPPPMEENLVVAEEEELYEEDFSSEYDDVEESYEEEFEEEDYSDLDESLDEIVDDFIEEEAYEEEGEEEDFNSELEYEEEESFYDSSEQEEIEEDFEDYQGEYEEEAYSEDNYEAQYQEDDVFDFDDGGQDYNDDADEDDSYEEDYGEDDELTVPEDDSIYLPKLRKEERNLYTSYRKFMETAFYVSKENGYEAPVIRVKAKNLGPRLSDRALKTLQEDMVGAWTIFASVYPYELGNITGNEDDNFLIELAENSEDDTLKEIVLSHLEVMIEIEACEIRDEALKLKKEKRRAVNEFRVMMSERERIVDIYVDAIEKQKFPIDARKLVTNYLRAASKDYEKAFNVLTTNPAMFSPIQVDKMPKKLFGLIKPSPSDAKKMNKKIATFLKKFKPK